MAATNYQSKTGLGIKSLQNTDVFNNTQQVVIGGTNPIFTGTTQSQQFTAGVSFDGPIGAFNPNVVNASTLNIKTGSELLDSTTTVQGFLIRSPSNSITYITAADHSYISAHYFGGYTAVSVAHHTVTYASCVYIDAPPSVTGNLFGNAASLFVNGLTVLNNGLKVASGTIECDGNIQSDNGNIIASTGAIYTSSSGSIYSTSGDVAALNGKLLGNVILLNNAINYNSSATPNASYNLQGTRLGSGTTVATYIVRSADIGGTMTCPLVAEYFFRGQYIGFDTAGGPGLTVNNASVVYIDAPQALTNVNTNTIVNNYSLYVNGASYINGATGINGAVTITGNSTMSGTLNVGGTTTTTNIQPKNSTDVGQVTLSAPGVNTANGYNLSNYNQTIQCTGFAMFQAIIAMPATASSYSSNVRLPDAVTSLFQIISVNCYALMGANTGTHPLGPYGTNWFYQNWAQSYVDGAQAALVPPNTGNVNWIANDGSTYSSNQVLFTYYIVDRTSGFQGIQVWINAQSGNSSAIDSGQCLVSVLYTTDTNSALAKTNYFRNWTYP